MSSPNSKSLLLVGGLLSLCACGYQPVYDRDGPHSMSMSQYEIIVAGDREGFVLEELLENRLGMAGSSSAYVLTVSLQLSQSEIAIAGAGGIDRFAADGVASFEVRDRASGLTLRTGEVTGSASWTSTKATVATSSAKLDAMDRLLAQIADRIATRLIAFSESWTQ